MSGREEEQPGTSSSGLDRTGRRSTIANRVRGEVGRAIAPAATFACLLAVWQVYTVVSGVPTVILPSPLDVAGALADTYPALLGDVAVTAATAGLGLLAGTAVGLAMAMAMVRSRTVSALVLPYVVGMRIAPMIAIAPLLFLWIGRGIPARAALVATLTLFPITVATVDGLRSTPERYLDLARSVDAAPATIFLRVRLPAAAPSVFAGFKIAATLSVIGAVVAEFVTLDAGIGTRVFETATFLRTAETYAALVALSLLGLTFYLIPLALERVLWIDEG